MFYENEKVKSCKQVTASERDKLVLAGVKPGTIGTVISEVTLVTVNFGGKLVTLSDESLESAETNNYKNDNVNMDAIKNLFGFK